MYILKNKGITVIEIIIVISIIVALSAIILPSLSSFRRERSLDNATQDIISMLNKARNDTVSSLNSMAYGVHFESDKVTYFQGPTFNSIASSNVVLLLDPSVNIPSTGGINLGGGGSDVIFTRLTGDTVNYGTIILQLTSDATRQKTITISKTGAISSN